MSTVTTVTIDLPSMLCRIAGVPARVPVEATTIRAALDALVRTHPTLEVHLFDESGGLREHVLCFHNDANTRWLPSLDVPVAGGDRMSIIQAVSGG